MDTLAFCNECKLLANIKKLAVHTENTTVAGDILSKMRQESVYIARLKGQAGVCQFTARCQCSNFPNHDACVVVDYSHIVVRDQVILGCADHDIKLDCLIEKGPNASLGEIMTFVESKESGELSLQQLNGESDAAAPVSPFRKQQRGIFKQQTPPTPLLTPTCTHCDQVGHGSSRGSAPTTAQHTAKPARNAASMAILLPYADSSQRPSHATGNGARACHRKRRTLQLSSSQSLCSVENAHPIDDNEIICNLRDFELEHCIYDPSHDTWLMTTSPVQPHYPCDTRALGLQTPLRRPTKAALVSVVADTGCQSCLAGTNLLFKLGHNMRHVSKARLQITAANGNNLDIIGAIVLRLICSCLYN